MQKKDIYLTGLKMILKYVFYKPEHNAKGDPMELKSEV